MGEVVEFQLPADKDDQGHTLEWVFLEGKMGRKANTYQLVHEEMDS